MIRKLVLASAAMTLVVGIGIAYALTQQVVPADAGGNCLNSLTPAEFNTWFDAGAVSLNGAVKPADSVNFPDVPNCSFYKWSEQMFLWLTSPAPPRYGSRGGLIMNTPAFYDVTPPDAMGQRKFVPHTSGFLRVFNLRASQKGPLDLPVILEKRTLRVLEILPTPMSREGRQMVADQNGNQVEIGRAIRTESGKAILFDLGGREIQGPRAILQPELARKIELLRFFDKTELIQQITLEDKSIVSLNLFGSFPETEQGQADGRVLMAQNGSLVYYALTVNNVFALYRTMQGAAVPAGTQFPITQADLDAVTNFAAANGQPPVIDPEALAIEIKSAWIEASSLDDPSQFIQMKATVPTYDTSNPNDWVQNGTKTTTLAMVGMHVVGSTGSTNPQNPNDGHPEMLWATFEHLSNGPTAAYSYTKTPSGTGNIGANAPGDWLFASNGSTGPFNVPHMKPLDTIPGHLVAAPPFTISPSDTRREMPWGMSGSSPTSNAQVISINNKVRSLLDPADVRRNYIHIGTTWTKNGVDPFDPTVLNPQVGTNKLANTTMETYSQGINCFDCHFSNTTTVSHIFDTTEPLF
ncbi:MAG TPA: hypothetical protein VKK31_14005 [Thermoanaerobaculia bacterium]|nr:hypothetical protein [Thermoanaerobaculia bacterium]